MTSERKLSIVSLIIKVVGIILLGVAIYFIIQNAASAIKELKEKIETESFKDTFDRIKSIIKSNLTYFIILGSGLLTAVLTYVLDLAILTMSSWKSQAFGKIILFLSTLLPVLWVISWIGNIGIIVKTKVY